MRILFLFLFTLGGLFLSSCGSKPVTIQRVPNKLKPYTVNGKTYYPLPDARGYEEVCYASWYGPGFHRKITASGEPYNMYAYTAAHKLLPLGTYVLVTNLENGKQVVVRINDRGPFVKNRCIDLSYAAAKKIGLIKKGVAKVKLQAVTPGEIRINPHKHYYFQVGAFSKFSRALSLKLKLEDKFWRVVIKYAKVRGKKLYKVLIYLTDNFYQAVKLAQELKKQYKQGFLVAE